jgi:hypothetical protein
MEELLNRADQNDLVDCIIASRLCSSSDSRRTFIIEINLKPEEIEAVEGREKDFLVNLIDQLSQGKNRESIQLIINKLKNTSTYVPDQRILRLEYKLGSKRSNLYRHSKPTAKPAYFMDNQAFPLMPLDIGAVWGLQRSSFIGILISCEEAGIYENLINIESLLSQAIEEANKQPNSHSTVFMKREWIWLDISHHSTVPRHKEEIIDAVVDRSQEVDKNSEEIFSSNSDIPGFFFEIDAKKLHTGCFDLIAGWCETLLSQLFYSQSTAIIINIIRSIDEDIEKDLKRLRTKLQEIAEEIPVELMHLDYRLFFSKNISSHLQTECLDFIEVTDKPGLAFCSWMYNVLYRSPQREKLAQKERYYKDVINIYKTEKEKYSKIEFQENYNKISEEDIVFDIKAIAPSRLDKVYQKLLHLIVSLFPQLSREWVSAYVESEIMEAVRAALIVANHNDFVLLSDILMNFWVDAININTLDLDLLSQPGDIEPDFCKINNPKESLFLAFIRRQQYKSDKTIQTVLHNLALSFPSLQTLYQFCQNPKDKESEFLEQNDATQFTLAIRAEIKFNRIINQFKAVPASHIPTEICWLLAAIPPSQDNIRELVQLEAKKRAIFGLCTPQEWQQIQKRYNQKRQVLDCRRDRPLVF